MAMFMTSNRLRKEDILKNGQNLDFPESVKALMRGDLGQIKGGFPAEVQKIILKNEKPYTDRPNAHLDPIDFEKAFPAFQEEYGELGMRDFLASQLYPKVYRDYREHYEQYGEVTNLPTHAFFYGLEPNQEIVVTLGPGKNVVIKYLNMTAPDEHATRLVFFELNGQTRSVLVRDESRESHVVAHKKASTDLEIGAPLQGSISKILVREGEQVKPNDPLFVIEAMKMESTITAPLGGRIKKIHLGEKTLVEQDDLVLELE
jgi:pyruvate carboxylase